MLNRFNTVMSFSKTVIDSFHFMLSVLVFVTGRNEVVAKVIFLHLSVIHSVHRGCT